MMKIYDEVIKKELELMNAGAMNTAPVSFRCVNLSGKSNDTDTDTFVGNSKKVLFWPEDDANTIIFRSDMAYELGGGTLSAISSQTMTEDKELVPQDELLLYGPDLSQLKADTAYARLVFLRVKGEALGEGDALYNAIRKIDYTKYHVHPHGYMSRISSANHREPVRISKSALAEGLSFEKVGNAYLTAYHKHPQIEAVKIVFITDSAFDFQALEDECLKAEQITGALDHIFKDLKMDCHTCNLKEVCDEVEGLRELHFQNQG